MIIDSENIAINNQKETLGFGNLYNGYVDFSKIAPFGCKVPTLADFTELSTYLGGDSVSGGKLKSKRITPLAGGWTYNSGNIGSNLSKFNALPSGVRYINGVFGEVGFRSYFLVDTIPSSNTHYIFFLSYNNIQSSLNISNNNSGFSIRCLVIDTSWYTGKKIIDIDGNEYGTVQIGTQVWLTSNLKTTKYNDGTPIPKVTDNTAWAALTTAAYCIYGNASYVTEYNKYNNATDVDKAIKYFATLERDGQFVGITKTIYIESTVNRSSASDTDVAFLTSRGYTITIDIW